MNQPLHSKHTEVMPAAGHVDRMVDAHLAGSSDELTPSSGFVLSVMDAIHAEAEEPSPIAFPWRRVVPGIIASAFGLIALIVFAMRTARTSAGPVEQVAQTHAYFALSLTPGFTSGELVFGSVLLAACLSIAAVAASFRLIGRSQ